MRDKNKKRKKNLTHPSRARMPQVHARPHPSTRSAARPMRWGHRHARRQMQGHLERTWDALLLARRGGIDIKQVPALLELWTKFNKLRSGRHLKPTSTPLCSKSAISAVQHSLCIFPWTRARGGLSKKMNLISRRKVPLLYVLL